MTHSQAPDADEANARAHITRCLEGLAAHAEREDNALLSAKVTSAREAWHDHGRLVDPHIAQLIHHWAAREARTAGPGALAEAAATSRWMAGQGYKVPSA
ncbi:hypothetical protein ABZ490_40205 [Streptomyces sp. NPDC005811]|uniref:hypothetical protein n=1 Tax=Streptomyces sp. NPDC005811 TaxID=3154565 RepID=UPI0033F231C5